jgi:hypothetical protein
MTLPEILTAWEEGAVTAEEALEELAPYLLTHPSAASKILNKIIGMEDEPKAMSQAERRAAKRWEKNYRSE